MVSINVRTTVFHTKSAIFGRGNGSPMATIVVVVLVLGVVVIRYSKY